MNISPKALWKKICSNASSNATGFSSVVSATPPPPRLVSRARILPSGAMPITSCCTSCSATTLRTTPGILGGIIHHKRTEVAGLEAQAAALERQAYERKSHPRPFAEALGKSDISVIAEIKKASPSRGLLQPDFHPALIAH